MKKAVFYIVLLAATLGVAASCKKHSRLDQPVPTYTVSGRLVTSTGNPVPNYKLGLAFDNQYEGSILQDTTDATGHFEFSYSELPSNFIGRAKCLRIIDVKDVPFAKGLKGIPINANFKHDAVYDRGKGWLVLRLNPNHGIAKDGDTLYITLPYITNPIPGLPFADGKLLIPIPASEKLTSSIPMQWNANILGDRRYGGFAVGWQEAHTFQTTPDSKILYPIINGDPIVDTVDINY